MRRRSPVQQWLDSIPSDAEQKENTDSVIKQESEEGSCTPELQSVEDIKLLVPDVSDKWKRKSIDTAMLTSTPRIATLNKLQRDHSVLSEGCSPKLKNPLLRDYSLQSDGSGSSGSSVLNVLGARKVDAESVLLALGFGPSEKQQKLQRIPERFLVPSRLKGISTEKFIKDEHHSMRLHDCGVFGYRGLTGNPHAPPSTIVAKIMDCILQDDVREEALAKARHSIADIGSRQSPLIVPRRRMRAASTYDT